MGHKIQSFLTLSLLTSIFIFAWLLQTHFLLNGDISWDLLATSRLLSGGTYTTNFFDLNPPLIFQEYIPVIFLKHIFSLSEATALRLYLFFLSFISLVFCYRFLLPIFLKQDRWIAYSLLLTISLTFLILPMGDLGEREHMAIIFTMPWFLAIINRLLNQPISPLLAIVTGMFAFAGFAIKPYFFIPFLLSEIYFIFFTRNLSQWIRIELVTIILFTSIYLSSIFIFYPDYIHTVMPLGLRFYYAGFSDSWQSIVVNPGALFCYFSALLYLFQYKNIHYRIAASILFISMIGFLLAYYCQHANWHYHIIPAYSMGLLLLTLLFSSIIEKTKHTVLVSIYSAGMLFILFSYTKNIYLAHIGYKKNYTGLITFLKNHAEHKPVYFISGTPEEIFPAVSDANTQYASRFMHLFWLPGLIKHPSLIQHRNDENFLIYLMAQDIKNQKPQFIFIDIKKFKIFYENKQFDYLPYLLKNSEFKTTFKFYHYWKTIEKIREPHKSVYKYDIYQRNNGTIA